MKIFQLKLKIEKKSQNRWNRNIRFLIGLFLFANLVYCQNDASKEKANQEKLALANLAFNQADHQPMELPTTKSTSNVKVRKSNGSTKDMSLAFSTTRSTLKLGTTVYETLEFGNQEVLEIQYNPIFDESGALQSATNSSIQYKKNSSDRLPATKCETNTQKGLVCQFSENLILTLFMDSEQETMDSLLDKKLENTKASTCSPSSKGSGYGARWTTEQWILAFLWWDCFVVGNPNSCYWLSVFYCPVTTKVIQTPACDSSGICYCPIYEVNCRNEYVKQVGQTRCY